MGNEEIYLLISLVVYILGDSVLLGLIRGGRGYLIYYLENWNRMISFFIFLMVVSKEEFCILKSINSLHNLH